ncbi:MAG TPA: hypothetical protein PLC98_22730, partial [Anaerolineales bacterium]|nr:hypothetical protein [Anaerolineales bacterium]
MTRRWFARVWLPAAALVLAGCAPAATQPIEATQPQPTGIPLASALPSASQAPAPTEASAATGAPSQAESTAAPT